MTTATWLRQLLLVLALAAVGAGAAACDNTIRGVGADAEDASDAINDATR